MLGPPFLAGAAVEPDIEDNKKIMPPSRRTGAARPVAKQAPPPARPSIPASTQSRAGAVPPPPAGRPAGAPPPAMAPAAAAPPMMGGGGGGGMLSGLGGMVMQGMAMGTGSAIAHRAVDSVMGPRQVEHVHNGQEAPAPAAGAAPHAMSAGGSCVNETDMFQQCVRNTGGDVSACQAYLDMLTNCKRMAA